MKRVGSAAVSLAALLLGVVSALSASAQSLRKDAHTNAAPIASAGQQTLSGKELFQRHCGSCHFTETTAQKIGPGLKGLYLRLKFSDGNKMADASLTRWIEAGGKNMPGFRETMKAAQIRELISYVKTL